MTTSSPVWLITGCSTGFGRELAEVVLAKGHRAVITARDLAKAEDIGKGNDRALHLKLDVTNDSDIEAVIKKTVEKFGRIDAVVNNAGYGYMAAIEEGEDKEIRAMFEANFFGLAAFTRAVLPQLRAQKSGHIFNISSIGGLVGFPGTGYYAATKFAVEGLSEALAKEVAPLGIKVTVIEPGPFRTDWAGRSLKMTGKEIPAYAETAGARRKQISGYSGNQPGDPKRAAELMVKLFETAEPPLHIVLGKPGREFVMAKLDALHKDLETWKEAGLATDFPDTKADAA
jgi:NAD(P)-dependent dehydrogenase (short-subunit alcohol dehydrogenase family)